MLKDIPDFSDWKTAKTWAKKRLLKLAFEEFTKPICDSFISIPAPSFDADETFGPYGSSDWRRFALGAFFADWATYETSADRISFQRAANVIATFPQGFRLGMCRLSDGQYTPVGYTGWYPLAENSFGMLHDTPERVTHRSLVAPLGALKDEGNYIYVINASIVPQLQHSPHSRKLLQTAGADLANVDIEGIATVTVSEDGINLAKLFGLEYRGEMTHEGEGEGVYTARLSTPIAKQLLKVAFGSPKR